MNDAEKIVRFIHYAEKLKTELRHASRSDNNRESVAEHCWRLSLFLVLVVPKLKTKVDFLKVLKMAIVHDLVEIEAKDVPVLQSVNNEQIRKQKFSLELKAMNKIKRMLGDDGKEIYDLWREFEELKTIEAKVVRSLDWLEGQLQFLNENVTTFSSEDTKTIDILLKKTTLLCKVDPLLAQLDRITLPDRRKRIKH
ncbi:MAG: HD domain-containing protein [Candidatus Berkelbacteria bacterium]|nr:HD domain-containing protein [Candidatus Berkelbacteria bacterium]MCR4307991.1 HD domain-containing protein [Candidatus Berkelbacteria bacterium]